MAHFFIVNTSSGHSGPMSNGCIRPKAFRASVVAFAKAAGHFFSKLMIHGDIRPLR